MVDRTAFTVDGYEYGRARLSRFTNHDQSDYARGRHLDEPWIFEGRTYVCSGSMGLRINSIVIEDVPAFRASVKQVPYSQKLDAWIEEARAQTEFLRPVNWQLPEELPRQECVKCEGRGTEHECDNCEHNCDKCKGDGFTIEQRLIVLGPKSGGLETDAKFVERNIRWLTMAPPLPGLQISQAPSVFGCHLIVWAHGEGLIMRAWPDKERPPIVLYEEDLPRLGEDSPLPGPDNPNHFREPAKMIGEGAGNA